MQRRDFLRMAAGVSAGLTLGSLDAARAADNRPPNVVFLLSDQWRAQDVGYAGSPDVITPHIDKLAAQSINLTTAVSNCPVCSPYRGSLMTGQYPLAHGVFMNDVPLPDNAVSIAKVFKAGGYDTAYIGKWHLDGRGRSSFTPPERRHGFDFWRALECTHNYNNSIYYADDDTRLVWDGYDAIAQTREAQSYIRRHADGKPFLLLLSWGPPHDPYQTAPSKHRAMFENKNIALRPNVPDDLSDDALRDIRGYYSHIAALDDCVGWVCQTLAECGLADNTILVFTSDHGDMLRSQAARNKQRPWDESILVPFLISWPAGLGPDPRQIDMPFGTPDIMPTLLSLCRLPVPTSVQGRDYSAVLRGKADPDNDAQLIMCPQPFGQWTRKAGGREYRGVRTRRYTYARDLDGPWVLYDNAVDPYQQNNLVNKPEHADLQKELEAILARLLKETGDEFLPGPEYLKKWQYTVDASGTVPYRN